MLDGIKRAGHIVWIQNKAWYGTHTFAAATFKCEGGQFDPDFKIDLGDEVAHKGYHIEIPDSIDSYCLVFGVILSTEKDKWRGPFTNNGDQCWHFKGSEDDWDVYPCP
ncbi:18179_t:CDS:1 [Funneliformis geosporum]|uniref:18179_t:CDS:1 n=1 Tax=Funneliformis geosporum TaxID=1117311 RepID=A0A9W4SHA3_9GLOM|nr:18179_t:CDS:1 [Funneliformis geosporum]